MLTADAAGAITIDSTVTSADISTSAAGAIDLDETDAITLTDVDTNDGTITVDAGGAITVTDVGNWQQQCDCLDHLIRMTSPDWPQFNAGSGAVTLNSAERLWIDQ